MAINFRTLTKALRFVCRAHHPIIIRGRHGIGKSCVSYDLSEILTREPEAWVCLESTATWLKDGNTLPVIERRASQMTEGDLLGLPKLEVDRTCWLAPDWLKEACESPVLLFIDEIDRATTEVRQGFFELCDSRKIAGHRLHPDTIIIAAVNGGEHGSQYQVGEMDPAELDRYTVFDVDPDVEDWLNWAKTKDANGKTKVIKPIVEFIRENPTHLEHNDDFEPNKVYPSRRSWDRLSQTMAQGGDELYKLGESNPILVTVAQAFVGLEATVSFVDYIQNYAKNVTVEDIVRDGSVELTDDFDLNQHCALIEKIDDANVLENEISTTEIENVGKYFCVLPSEAAMKLWGVLAAGNIKNTIAFHNLGDAAKYLLALVSEEAEKESNA